MGTSSGGGGARNTNPLLPTWIPTDSELFGASSPDTSLDNESDNGNDQTDDGSPPSDQDGPDSTPSETNTPPDVGVPPPKGQRYRQPRQDFNKYVSSGGKNTGALQKALKGYSRKSAGGTSKLARRMAPSTSRVASFYRAINTIKSEGLETALKQFKLSTYKDKSLSETLSALCDEIFKDTQKIYENTQDDSITKLAYSNTVVRICEFEDIDLNKLTNGNIEVMIATFIEETIAQRVICDIGNELTKRESDPNKLIEIEESVYQIVNGLVRNKIMPEIKATQIGDQQTIERNIENIYRIAFDAMAEAKI